MRRHSLIKTFAKLIVNINIELNKANVNLSLDYFKNYIFLKRILNLVI